MATPVLGRAQIRTGGRSHASVELQFDLVGQETVHVALSRFGEAVQDWRPFWRTDFAPWFYDFIGTLFGEEGKPVGGWARLSEPYRAWKAATVGDKPILQFSGDLMKSLTWAHGAPGAKGIFQPAADGLVLGTSIPYAGYHQLGAKRTRSSGFMPRQRTGADLLPQRKFFAWPYNASETLGRMLHRFALRSATENGLRTQWLESQRDKRDALEVAKGGTGARAFGGAIGGRFL